MKNNVTVLGIDPGTATTGWAILLQKGGIIQPVAFGHIETSKHCTDAQRLEETANDIQSLIDTHKPDEAAVESLFFFKNQKTIITVAQSRGACLLTLEKNNLPVAEYTPLQVKQALTGYGKADKQQMQLMVTKTLKLKETPQPDDTADAIAVALCHLQSRNYPTV